MTHDKFETCAPKTTIVEWGYKVNSTRCTIMNWKLYDLIDTDDKVAHSHGAFLGCTSFSTNDALESLKLSEESSKMIYIKDWEVRFYWDEKVIKPRGFFQNSKVTLLDNWFSLYEKSDYIETSNYIYNSVAIVDDRADFIESAQNAFSWIENLKTNATTSKKQALEFILKENPEAALLDMHLTNQEEFDWLWIANQLVERGYEWEIMIISGYPKDKLAAMRELIKREDIHIPGKDLSEIKKCLTWKCKC